MARSTRPDTIELEIFGQPRTVPVPVPQGPSTLLDLLPPARALADAVSSAAIDHARGWGQAVSCRAGCAACCRQMVGISAVEAQALADLVTSMPPQRRADVEARFADAVARLEAAGLLDPAAPRGHRRIAGTEPGGSAASARAASARYFALRIACPFLEEESCSIYPDRPLICREYNVTSPPEHCATFRDPAIRPVRLPLHAGGPLARTAAQLAGLEIATLPITLALEWSAAHAPRLASPQSGGPMYDAWLASMGAANAPDAADADDAPPDA